VPEDKNILEQIGRWKQAYDLGTENDSQKAAKSKVSPKIEWKTPKKKKGIMGLISRLGDETPLSAADKSRVRIALKTDLEFGSRDRTDEGALMGIRSTAMGRKIGI
jgi:hypothetical protein